MFLASLVYRARLRIAGATQRNPMLDASEKKKIEKVLLFRIVLNASLK